MRLVRKSTWLPLVATLTGLMVSPLIAQDTSDETKKTETAQQKVEVVADGQIVISDGDGNIKVMKLKKNGDNAFVWEQETGHSKDQGKIIVRQESGTKTDGEARTGMFRALLVGPEGKQEVELKLDGADGTWVLGDGEAGQLLQLVPGVFDKDDNTLLHLNAHVKGFMIGVSCDAISDTLKKQLGIESGLVVESIVEDSPSDGKLEEHDILIHAGDVNLTEIDQLIEAVQSAGDGEKELALTVLRNGKKVSVSLTPKKRELPEVLNIEDLGENGFLLKMVPELKNAYSFDFETVGPGVIEWKSDSDEESPEVLKVEIDRLRKKLEELSGKLEGKK